MVGLIKKVKKRHVVLLGLIMLGSLFSYFILPVAKPLILALITAVFLERIVKYVATTFEIKRAAAVICVFVGFVLLTIGIITFIATKSIVYLVNFAENLPLHLQNINNIYLKVEELAKTATQDLPKEFVKSVVEGANETFNSFLDVVKDKLSLENITSALKVIPSFMVSFVVYILALFFIMLDLPKIKRSVKELMKPSTLKNTSFVLNKIENVVYGVFKAQIIISFYVLAITFVSLLILVPKQAIVMSLIIWLIDLLPIVGSIIVLFPWGIYELIQGNTTLGIGLLSLSIIIIVIRRVIEPKIMSVNIGLSPLATLISIFIGFKLLGVIGLILAPLTLIIYNSLRDEGILNYDIKF